MAKKYYAVKIGKVEGIFESWDECKKSIEGYPNAQYKGFNSKEKAENYLNDVDEEELLLNSAIENNTLIAYVDGSYSEMANKYSYGLVVVTPGGEIYEVADCGDDKNAIVSRNVSGEVKGVMHLINYMNKNSFTDAIIRYDYEGIENWATKKWRAKTYVAKEYVKFMEKHSNKLNLKFEKIQAHSNDSYNDRADKLAKKALIEGSTTRQVKKEGDSYTVIEGIEEVEELKTIVELMNEEYSIVYDCKEDNDLYIFSLHSGKDRLKINYYSNRNKVVVQGKKDNIYSVFISYLGVLINGSELIPVLNEYYNLSIDQEQLEHQCIRYLPNLDMNSIDKKRKAVLSQAVFNLNVKGNMHDYTFLVHPILRITEAYLKDIRTNVESQSIDICNLFDKNRMDQYSLKEIYKKRLVDSGKISHFNRIFNYYQRERHCLFHWDDMTTNLDTTKVITDFQEVNRIIEKGLDLINEYYRLY